MADKVQVRELILWAKSDKLLRRQRLIPWINNFARRVAKGEFNRTKATKALADYLAKDIQLRYYGKRSAPTMDGATKTLFGNEMMKVLMPAIRRTARNMNAKGLMKGQMTA